MFSFTILLTVFCLVYLPYTNCEKADGYVQQRNFVGVTAETIERSVKHDSSAKGETTSNRKKTSQGGKNINPAKNSSSPAIIRPKRQKRESKYDLLHGMYTAYNFNWHFESFSLKDASSKKYSEVRNSFEPMVDEIISENQLPDLTSNHGPTWRALNESLVESYYDERGVIVFDQEFFRWVYCGWLIIDSDNIRMCAPLLPLGLKDIERNALKNSDYIPKDTAKFAYALSKGQKKSGKSSSNGKSKKDGDGMLAGLRKIVSKLMTVRIDYLLVNLFADNADTYNENCECSSLPSIYASRF